VCASIWLVHGLAGNRAELVLVPNGGSACDDAHGGGDPGLHIFRGERRLAPAEEYAETAEGR